MKKIILAIALFAAVNAHAQKDGFFTYNSFEDQNRQENVYGDGTGWGTMPTLLGHGYKTDQTAPVGSGLLLLAGMGLAYGMRKKSK